MVDIKAHMDKIAKSTSDSIKLHKDVVCEGSAHFPNALLVWVSTNLMKENAWERYDSTGLPESISESPNFQFSYVQSKSKSR